MMFGSWLLQLVATSYGNRGHANYQLPWVEGEGIFQQNQEKNWQYHSNGRGSCFARTWDGRYWPQGPNSIWQVSNSFFILYIIVWFLNFVVNFHFQGFFFLIFSKLCFLFCFYFNAHILLYFAGIIRWMIIFGHSSSTNY